MCIRFSAIALLAFSLLGRAQAPANVSAEAPAPPATRQDNVRETIHGVEITDPYRWLEEQGSAETRKWVAEQNKYSHGLLDGRPGRAAVSKRLAEMLRHDTVGSPSRINGWYFFTKKGADQDLASIYRRKGPNGPDEL